MIQDNASAIQFDEELDKLSREFDPNNPTFFFTIDIRESNVVNWRKMVLKVERELASNHRQEMAKEKENLKGKQSYLSYLDQLEEKYCEGEKDHQTDWYDVNDEFIDDSNLKDKNSKVKTKIGGYFVCRGAPEVVPPNEDYENNTEEGKFSTQPKNIKHYRVDDIDKPLTPEVQKWLALLRKTVAEFDKNSLKELLAEDPNIEKPEHQRIAMIILNTLNASAMLKQKKRNRLFMKIGELLPYPDSQPKTFEKKLKKFVMQYKTVPKVPENLTEECQEAKLTYLFNLLKKEKLQLFRRLKRQVKLEVKIWESSGKLPCKYKYNNFQNMVDDLCKAVHVINAEAQALRYKNASCTITNKAKRTEFFEKIVDIWPVEYQMTLQKFIALWEKHRKQTRSFWKVPRAERSPSSLAMCPKSEKLDSSRVLVPMITTLTPISQNSVLRKRPMINKPKQGRSTISPKRAKLSVIDVLEITSNPPVSANFYLKPGIDPWADWRFVS